MSPLRIVARRLPRRPPGIPPVVSLVTAGLLVLIAVIPPAGCAKRSPVEAESRETRLTQGGGLNGSPVFSPDGRLLAFAHKSAEDGSPYILETVPVAGGEPRAVYSDSSFMLPLAFAKDGQSLFVLFRSDNSLRRIGMDGKELETVHRPRLGDYVGITSDNRTLLIRAFNGDNWDLALRPADRDSGYDVLAETPAWEFDGCFGPKPGDVTAVSMPVYGATTTEFSVWSPESREYKPLPVPKARNHYPAWSPDGRFLSYASDQAGNLDLWILDSVTGRTTQVTGGTEEDAHPSWSPDGELLAFSRDVRTSHVFIENMVSGETTQITEGAPRDVFAMPSMDGKWILFLRHAGAKGQGTTLSLCVSPSEDPQVRQLDLQGLILSDNGGVGWSPDEAQIAFAADDGTGNVDIYRIPRGGGPVSRITTNPGSEILQEWSPDGRWITYLKPEGGETQIWAIPATGGIPRQVTRGGVLNEAGIWDPKGERIAYLSLPSEGGYQIHVVSFRDPANDHQIMKGDSFLIPVAWSKDGKEVLIGERSAKAQVLWACSVDGSERARIGSTDDLLYGGMPAKFDLTPEGERYRDVIYPGGIRAYVDGDHTSDVYLLRVGELLRASQNDDKAGVAR